ncbi:hypothetical protein [Streptomyces sp. NBC_00859]|uniref:hypothetical protein n=1 Tax=Streptomyces sp. NBC_00859 TaxID=2903682 RepID=UPI00386E1796|nr:hypothetical protein OG584_19745 [Streptomyces sp. NBC_00859]
MTPTATPSPPSPGESDASDDGSCRECEEFELAEAVARAEGDASRETDCRVLRGRHRQSGHGGRQA